MLPSHVMQSEMDTVLPRQPRPLPQHPHSPFPTRCLDFTGVKNRFIPPVKLEPNFIFMGEMKSTYATLEGLKGETITFKMQ